MLPGRGGETMGLPEQDDTPSRYNLQQRRGREDAGAHPRACCFKTPNTREALVLLGIRLKGRVGKAELR